MAGRVKQKQGIAQVSGGDWTLDLWIVATSDPHSHSHWPFPVSNIRGWGFILSLFETAVQRTSCPHEYMTYRNNKTGAIHCYLVRGLTYRYLRHFTWVQAQAACRQSGGELASIHNHLDMDALRTYVLRTSSIFTRLLSPNIWIGLNDVDHEHYFQ